MLKNNASGLEINTMLDQHSWTPGFKPLHCTNLSWWLTPVIVALVVEARG